MKKTMARMAATLALGALAVGQVQAGDGGHGSGACSHGKLPQLSFIDFTSPNIDPAFPKAQLTIKGKLSLPRKFKQGDDQPGCVSVNKKLPAVLILHGSAGVDARGDFYEAALNDAGIATLQIDMWEARGVSGIANRPALPIFTYPDAFMALAFLAARPEIDANRIGVMGFSWGGVVSLGTAEQAYTGLFGGGRQFAAHLAHYPVCWGANQVIAGLPPANSGTLFRNLTGAPVLIQIGSLDDYDKGAGPCNALAAAANATHGKLVAVNEYPGVTHAWDRLQVSVVAADPFADLGSYFRTGVMPLVRITPDIDAAFESRGKAVKFFERHL
ncbi:MAG: dienelactone hydrolase family protein [Rhodoferax sp.]|nr:dienelactone hydrolase family protein [Rhodoferax sp.]